ncbi:flagellar hook-basal body complex protein FliE [Buchnera aphidicola (Kurisakia onigurumii)]|uniref:flagellar hook-basal body complex protein FliE n=1 Tax=Buchnera aphidicola TaxID=9 RepID=UPI0031B691F3
MFFDIILSNYEIIKNNIIDSIVGKKNKNNDFISELKDIKKTFLSNNDEINKNNLDIKTDSIKNKIINNKNSDHKIFSSKFFSDDSNVIPLNDFILEMQKKSITLQILTCVKNKVLRAYHDIMHSNI